MSVWDLEPEAGGIDPLPIGDVDASRVGYTMAHGTWWSADLLRLIAKSDRPHRERLRLAFPSHVAAYEKWYAEGDPVSE